ncbi:lysine N(6)-hydroxylase/L-ornithine N(5)-oxygenase family protein [Pseudarthrobacter sp. BIM B-2242]|uniref:lysine N(6)-hydroxylase/L-ornithine N(5)-oxygenase family protein n=1 Tax=Pseudarthrobacter sp. BIM B-2242 TaxID=2772401 RepID=UPI00168BA57F|nr:lysine N(6)-hydroxylase/L-ornithine N(5)-oxygenase family protein [Pseudarthrobacter sp. BIM B-2242]QOD03842.1 lysine N(6)-hydroxylase/L-ornithine N(5)-oxygenase family protein [Pseudarthrobacter sp. BIM B-2242]
MSTPDLVTPTEPRIYDFAGIGVGPFNLGLAALSEPVDGLDGIFLEQREHFDWHPGMMLEPAHLQVPFMADLVTLADPTSPYSFLNFLKQTGRLYRFYIRENFYPLRAEYNQYCQWVAGQLRSVRFSTAVLDVTYDAGVYRLSAEGPDGPEVLLARRLVLGTGTAPYVPAACDGIVGAAASGGGGLVLHNADYLSRKSELQARRSITIVGSGQSAAEIYYELLQDIDACGYQLNWVTRSGRFFPLEYTKLTLEMTSPEYVDYFHGLPQDQRDGLIKSQKNLYKGINSELIDAIYDLLYTKSLSGMVDTRLLTHSSLTGGSWNDTAGSHTLQLRHEEQGADYTLDSEAVVLATGYTYREPGFLAGIQERIARDSAGRFAVARNYSTGVEPGEIFVQNAELHTHGFVTPDLGMAAYRNSCILREITGREVYPVERSIAFQQFGPPAGSPDAAPPAAASPAASEAFTRKAEVPA